MTVDFGFVQALSLGSYVWEDQNNDGLQDSGEPAITGAVVELFVDNSGSFDPAVDVNGAAVISQTTGADGLYNFTNLPPGDYRIQVTPPAGYEPASTQTITNNNDTFNDSNIADEPTAGTYESGTFTLTIGGEPTETGSYAGDAQDNANETNGNMTVDFGFYESVSIGSYVWLDVNGDGVQDGTESGVSGAVVELLVDTGSSFDPAVDVNGSSVISQTTGADGLYHFTNLPPGDYRVRVTPPAGLEPTVPQTTANNDDSEDDSNIADEPVTGTFESGTFTLTCDGEPNESGSYDGDSQDSSNDADGNMTVDFGFVEPVSLGSFVWEDLNGDGQQDSGEPGITGAVVELFFENGGSFVPATDVDGTNVISQTTGADGLYNFTNLPPGNYRVRVTPPAGYSPTLTQNTNDDDNTEDDSNIATDLGSGVYESGTFTLTSNGEPLEVGTHDGDTQDTADNDGNMTVDFGFIEAVSLGSFVWEDQDSDGQQDIGEPGIAGAVVELFVDSGGGTFVAAMDVNGTAVPTQTTTISGEYLFSNLPPGDYRVQVTPPANFIPTPTQNGADNDDSEDDSNIDTNLGGGVYESGTFTLNLTGEPDETGTYIGDDQDDAAETDGNMTVDFGFVPVVSLGSFVWIDQNGDGLQDSGEPGIVGVTVTLQVDSGGGVFVPAVDVLGGTVSDVVTDAAGQYFFTNLPPGDYRVEVTPPATYMPSLIQNSADDDDTANDSNIASEPVIGTYRSGVLTLTTGGEPTEAGSLVGDDQDNSAESSGNMTLDFGFIEPVSIGSLVWEDLDYSGTQGGSEPEIVGAIVELLVDNGVGSFVPATDVDGTAVISQTTGTDGLYYFDNLPPGDYRVRVTPPAIYVPTSGQNTSNNDDQVDDSNIASEPVSGTYESGTFTLSVDGEPAEAGGYHGDNQDNANETDGNMTVDFGFVQPLSIASFVWEDENSNGLQDSEPGIAGADVTLWVDDGFGTFIAATDINGAPVLTQTTAADGLYNFTNLPAGSYRVQVTPPSDYQPTSTQTIGNDDNTEADSNIASEPATGTFESGTFTLTVNGEPVETGTYDGDDQDDAVDNNGNMTVDFGFVPVVSIGSVVWEDLDGDGVQESGEPGLSGATVTLWVDNGSGSYIAATDVTGTPVTSQTTGANGLYFFDNLPEGDYKVRVAPPTGYIPTENQVDTDNDNSEDDSNLADDLGGGVFESGIFTLTHNGEPTEVNSYDGDDQDEAVGVRTDDDSGNMTVDFGFFQPVAIGNVVWVDDGAGIGTHDNGVIDGSEVGLQGVAVELYWSTDMPGTDTPFATTTTDANGEYLFDMIPKGTYIVHIPASEFMANEPLMSFRSSTNHGGDVANDDDVDENGIDQLDPKMRGISSDPIALTPGLEPTSEAGQGSYSGTLVDADVNMTVDFGFFELLTLGNRVWFDSDNNAIIDDGPNPGVHNVVMNLLDEDGDPILHPETSQPITTTTDADGYYLFTHLLPDNYIVQAAPENFQAGGVLENYLSSTGSRDPDDDMDSDDNGKDSANLMVDGISSDPVTLDYDLEPDNNDDTDHNNNTNLSVDFGVYLDPTAVTLVSFTAASLPDKGVRIQWRTVMEIDNVGFRLYRSNENVFATAVNIHFEYSDMPDGNGFGATYQYEDTVPSNGTWYYWLVDVDTEENATVHGPISVSVSPVYQIFIPIVIR